MTRVGARVALLAYAHVAHECVIESDAVLVNAATLGGEVFVGHRAVIGGLTGIHQFCRIGRYTIIGAGSKVVQDLPPYLMADGHPARPYGPNRVGLERAGHSREQIEQIRLIYKLLYDDGLGLEEGMRRIRAEFAGSPFAEEVLAFCQGTSRGISRPRRRHTPDGEAILMEDLTGWME